MRFICLFFPAFASMNKANSETNIINYLRLYCINNMIINLLVLACIGYANKFEFKALLEDSFCVNFALKYIGLGLLFGLIIRMVENTINIEFIVEKKRNDKKNSKIISKNN